MVVMVTRHFGRKQPPHIGTSASAHSNVQLYLSNDPVVNIRKWHIIIILRLNYVIIYFSEFHLTYMITGT